MRHNSNLDPLQLFNQNVKLRRENTKLRRLAIGCSTHGSYRYYRASKADCDECEELFEIAQEIKLHESD